jgi:hypothetical protein
MLDEKVISFVPKCDKRQKGLNRLHTAINHILDDAKSQPRTAWLVIFQSAMMLQAVAQIIETEYGINRRN